jgi:hypothetical protein
MDNVEIWINPLANPDGTYYGGNNTIYGATRYNANSVDINRNFPDAGGSLHPDGKVHQPETVIFMDFADSMNFTMSANFHGGAEVVNYPWDTWVRLHADDAWWQTVSYRFADTTHNYSPSTYLDMYGSGVTNGYAWYHVDGSRQDYMNFYANCREVTLEISDQKTIPASQLNAHWNYLYRSMLNYMEQSTYGFQGQVTDSLTGFAVKAKLELIGHDMDNSFVYTNDSGFFFRPVASGYYDLQFSAPHYYSKTLNQVYVDMDSIVKLDVQLVRDYTAITISTGEPEIHIFPNPVSNRVIIKSNRTFDRVEVYDVNSKVVLSQSFNQTTDLSLKVDDLETGFYFMVIHHSHWISMRKLIIQH